MIKEDITPVATEMLVGHPKYSAGTLDFLCIHKGKLVIWDWKTSNSVDEYGYPLQVSAYKKFFEHMTRLKIQGIVIMKLSKESASFTSHEVPDATTAWNAFKLLCGFYLLWITKTPEQRIIKVKKTITL